MSSLLRCLIVQTSVDVCSPCWWGLSVFLGCAPSDIAKIGIIHLQLFLLLCSSGDQGERFVVRANWTISQMSWMPERTRAELRAPLAKIYSSVIWASHSYNRANVSTAVCQGRGAFCAAHSECREELWTQLFMPGEGSGWAVHSMAHNYGLHRLNSSWNQTWLVITLYSCSCFKKLLVFEGKVSSVPLCVQVQFLCIEISVGLCQRLPR